MRQIGEHDVLHIGRAVVDWRVIAEAIHFTASSTHSHEYREVLRQMARDLEGQLPPRPQP